MTVSRRTVFAIVATVGFATALTAPRTARAQDAGARRPIELGIDAAITRESSDSRTTTAFTLPISKVRVGFFLTDAVSLEPSVALGFARTTFESTVTDDEVTTSGTSYDLTVGLLYHFQPDRTKSQPYIRPFVGITGFTSDSDDDDDFDSSSSRVSFGGALGVKLPIANRLGTRIEVGYSHVGDDGPFAPSSNNVFLGFGLSFFTR